MSACHSAVQCLSNLADFYGQHAESAERIADDPRLSGLTRSVLLGASAHLAALRWALEECADLRTAGPMDELADLSNDWLAGRQVEPAGLATVGQVAGELLRLADDGNPHQVEE